MSDDEIEDAVLDVLGAADEPLSAEEVQSRIAESPPLRAVRVALRDLAEGPEVVRQGLHRWRASEPSPIAVERRRSGFTRDEVERARARYQTTDCPHCGKHGDVHTLFGWRRLKPEDKDLAPQSWCFTCRPHRSAA